MKTLLNYLLNKQCILSVVMYFLSNSKKEQIYIARFRAELKFWKHDVSEMKDEEIKEGISKASEIAAQCGMTTNEVSKVFKPLANCS